MKAKADIDTVHAKSAGAGVKGIQNIYIFDAFKIFYWEDIITKPDKRYTIII